MRQFYTAPTLIRALEAHDDKYVTGSERSSLRVLGTVGEPINPRAWNWFFHVRPFTSPPDLFQDLLSVEDVPSAARTACFLPQALHPRACCQDQT